MHIEKRKSTKIEILADSDLKKTGVITLGYFINFGADTDPPKGNSTSYVPRT